MLSLDSNYIVDVITSDSMREVKITSVLQGFGQKKQFFEKHSWFKFSNLGIALGMTLKFYTSVKKGLKLKVRKFWGLIPTFAEVTVEKPVGRTFLPPILNRVKKRKFFHIKIRIDSWVKRR